MLPNEEVEVVAEEGVYSCLSTLRRHLLLGVEGCHHQPTSDGLDGCLLLVGVAFELVDDGLNVLLLVERHPEQNFIFAKHQQLTKETNVLEKINSLQRRVVLAQLQMEGLDQLGLLKAYSQLVVTSFEDVVVLEAFRLLVENLLFNSLK